MDVSFEGIVQLLNVSALALLGAAFIYGTYLLATGKLIPESVHLKHIQDLKQVATEAAKEAATEAAKVMAEQMKEATIAAVEKILTDTLAQQSKIENIQNQLNEILNKVGQ